MCIYMHVVSFHWVYHILEPCQVPHYAQLPLPPDGTHGEWLSCMRWELCNHRDIDLSYLATIRGGAGGHCVTESGWGASRRNEGASEPAMTCLAAKGGEEYEMLLAKLKSRIMG
jgi:hypothetical protein